MEVACSFKTLVYTYKTALHKNIEDPHLNSHCCRNHRFYNAQWVFCGRLCCRWHIIEWYLQQILNGKTCQILAYQIWAAACNKTQMPFWNFKLFFSKEYVKDNVTYCYAHCRWQERYFILISSFFTAHLVTSDSGWNLCHAYGISADDYFGLCCHFFEDNYVK